MSFRRALPTEFRSRDFVDNDSVLRGTRDVGHSAFVENLRLRRPELFAEEDEVTFANAAVIATGPHQNGVPRPIQEATAVVLSREPFAGAEPAPAPALIEAAEDFTVGFGGIASPPSHDFPI